ncbi:MAG: ROK family protein [Pseudomonadota bacterium]
MRIGVDLGGTKIEVVALSDDPGHPIIEKKRISTPRDYHKTIEAIVGLVDAVEKTTGKTGTVGVGMPGVVSPHSGKVKNANSTWLNGKPFDVDLKAALGRPLRCANDANCLAVSEAIDGAAAGHAAVFGVILGTGCGGGLAIDGRVHTGGNAIAVEWGHIPLPWATGEEVPGPLCYCGKRGCMETWVAGPSFEREYEKHNGVHLKGHEIAARAAEGDEAATKALNIYADRLARGLSIVITLIDPDVIVLGGGVSNISQLYDLVPPLLPRYVFGGEAYTPIVQAKHGDSSGVRGAAWLWPPEAA